MIKLKLLLFILSFWSLTKFVLLAQSANPTYDRSKESIKQALLTYFNSINGLEYTSTESLTIAGQPSESSISVLIYRGKEPFFDIKSSSKNAEGKEINSIVEMAYDGNYLQARYDDGSLRLSRSKPFKDSLLCVDMANKTDFFRPFWFLNAEAHTEIYQVDHIWDYKTFVKESSNLDGLTCIGEETFDGKDCIIVTLPADLRSRTLVARYYPTDITIRADLSKESGLYPLRWQIISKSRGVLFEYHVDELGILPGVLNLPCVYPKSATTIDYGTFRPVNFPTPVIQKSVITSVNINSAWNADDFTIDPGMARFIYDEDKHEGFAVPR
jgi:hypothetical protein